MAEQNMRSGEALLGVQQRISRFLDENCAGACLDNDEERDAVADKLALFLFGAISQDMSPHISMPRAQHRMAINIHNEMTGERIISLSLQRTPDMTDGDFMQMQNFFWCEIGRLIKNNPNVLRTLTLAGIDVSVDPVHGENSLG